MTIGEIIQKYKSAATPRKKALVPLSPFKNDFSWSNVVLITTSELYARNEIKKYTKNRNKP